MRYLINNVVLKCRSFNPSKLHLQKIDDPSTNQVDITQSRELYVDCVPVLMVPVCYLPYLRLALRCVL